jgi:hypothetical protein
MRAKYCPTGSIWEINMVTGSTPLWKKMVELKDFFKESSCWQLGNGTKVMVLGQPWYDEWAEDLVHNTSAEIGSRLLTVADLIDDTEHGWHKERLAQCLGPGKAGRICETLQPPQIDHLLPDRLI